MINLIITIIIRIIITGGGGGGGGTSPVPREKICRRSLLGWLRLGWLEIALNYI